MTSNKTFSIDEIPKVCLTRCDNVHVIIIWVHYSTTEMSSNTGKSTASTCDKSLLNSVSVKIEKVEEDEQTGSNAANKFANDGSFLSMCLKMQQNDAKTPNLSTKPDIPTSSTNCDRNSKITSSSSITGNVLKRRKPLKVGVIKKQKNDASEDDVPQDAWSKYMNEVRKYKEKYGDDSDKNRPLVK